ncbi:MAG: response regulator [Pelosinus sp.]|nr:response regulator [Pelosinus sp.]
MSTVKVMVVDDSPFSRTIIAEALTGEGYEVVGEADCLDELMNTYNKLRPDIVTMDIAMPGADGFECSKALRLAYPDAKIILVSSMKDEETEAEARRIGVAGYVQKPVEGESLKTVITNILSPDSLFNQLKERGFETFKEALGQNITRMIKLPAEFEPDIVSDKEYLSQGITVVVGIIGRYSGSMILDMSAETAEKLAEAVLRRPPKNNDEVLAMAAELANIVGGIACSMMNKKDKSFGLRVSPPSLFHGTPAQVVCPNLKIEGVYAKTDLGRIFLGVGFKKGSILWM